MNLTQDTLGFLLISSMAFLFLLIFASIYYLWKKTEELEKKTTSHSKRKGGAVTGDLLGLTGKEIWDFVVGEAEDVERVKEVKQKLVFVLQRHVEMILEQGLHDSRSGRISSPSSEASVGVFGEEITSWIPDSYSREFYEIGRSLNFSAEEDDLMREARLSLNEVVSSLVKELNLEIKIEAFVDRLIGALEPSIESKH